MLYHKCFGDQQRINFVRFSLPDVVLSHRGSLNRIDDADLVASGDEEFNQVIAVVCR